MRAGAAARSALSAGSSPRRAQSRSRVAAGFAHWSDAISDQLQALDAKGGLPPGANPDDLAVTILAALQGGLLLAQIQRATPPPRNNPRLPPRPHLQTRAVSVAWDEEMVLYPQFPASEQPSMSGWTDRTRLAYADRLRCRPPSAHDHTAAGGFDHG